MFSYLLTSNSFANDNIRTFFENVVCSRCYKTAAIITTANPNKEKATWAQVTYKKMQSIGLKSRFVDFERGENIDGEDIVYVCGGNTFTLIEHARKVEFHKSIHRLRGYNGLYIGSSAGSVIVGHSIMSAELGPYPDKNIIGCNDMNGLGFLDFNIVAHYKEDYANVLESCTQKTGKESVGIKDNEALWIVNNHISRIL